MVKWMVTIIGSWLLTCTVFAQTNISGTVKNTKGRAISGASIVLKDTYDGGITDSAGHFAFITYEKGNQILQVKLVNYKAAEQKIVIAGQPIQVIFNLKEEVNELMAVTVTAGSFEAGDKKRAATVLSQIDIYTTGGANGDLTSALKTLPGSQQVGEQEGLFVRGGAGYETKQIIDGTVVNNPFFASIPDIAQRGRFAPSLFKGNVFSTGGYSALYGQALSSVLLLESVDLPARSEASASISSVFLGGGLQELAKNKKSSFGFNYGYTNLALYFALVQQKPDYFKMPQLHAADANYRFKTKNGIVKYYTTFASNELGLRRLNIDNATLKNAFGLSNTNWYNNISWKETLGNGWKMNLAASFSTDNTNINQQIQNANNQPVKTGLAWIDTLSFNVKTRSDLSQLKAVFDKRISGISVLHFGGEYWYSYNKTLYNYYTTVLPDHFKALFTEADLYLTNNIAAKIGVRFEHSSLLSKSNIAPRISIAYKTGKDAQMSAAYGIFYQKPENTYLAATTHLTTPVVWDYTKATHYILNYIKNTQGITFRVEAFYKKYEALVKTAPYGNTGSGYAQGIELFYRDKTTIKGFDYWISYSYLDTKRNFLNYPQQLQPNFATPHTLSLVTKKVFPTISTGFNFTYTYATGRPYYNLVYNNSANTYSIADNGTTNSYHNVGFSCNYLAKMGKAFGVFVVSATNVLGSNLVYNYNFAHDGHKEAVTPPAPHFFFLGLFLSWGVDKTQDAINNNL